MIARTSFLPRLFVTFGLAGATSAVAACGGRVVSLGNTGNSADQLKAIDPTTSVPISSSQPAGACPAGYAHPNICCDATPGTAATCGEWTVDPFRACSEQGASWQTYPNAFQCCDLSNPTACIETPPDAGVPPPPPPFGCGFVCPPGWWSEGDNTIAPVTSSSSSSSGSGGTLSGGSSTGNSGSTGTPTPIYPGSSSGSSSGSYGGSGGCCTIGADGTTICDGFGYAEPVATGCSGGGSSSGSTGVAPTPQPGPIILDDGGVLTEDAGPYDGGAFSDDGGVISDDGGYYGCDAGDPYPPGYDGGTGSLCGECPPGWLVDAVDSLLCCQTTADNVTECFSQATGSASGIGYSGGSSTGSAGSGSSSSGGGVSSPPVSYPADAGVVANGGN